MLIDFSSPNWGTVKLKWMLPENHTQRNITTNTSKDTDTMGRIPGNKTKSKTNANKKNNLVHLLTVRNKDPPSAPKKSTSTSSTSSPPSS